MDKQFECKCVGPQCCNAKHAAEIARFNARFHRQRFLTTGDRYHLGQWKAYYRIAKRLEETP